MLWHVCHVDGTLSSAAALPTSLVKDLRVSGPKRTRETTKVIAISVGNKLKRSEIKVSRSEVKRSEVKQSKVK